MTAGLAANTLYWAILAVAQVNYTGTMCNYSKTVYRLGEICENLDPSPLTDPEGFDVCFNYWLECQVGRGSFSP